jgi:hypothetical protein
MKSEGKECKWSINEREEREKGNASLKKQGGGRKGRCNGSIMGGAKPLVLQGRCRHYLSLLVVRRRRQCDKQ